MPDTNGVDLDRISKDFRMEIASKLIDSDNYVVAINHPNRGVLIYSSSPAHGKELTKDLSSYFDREVL
mgnify:CR=1 FL=1